MSPIESTDATLLPDERIDEVNEHLCLIQKKNGLTFGTDAYLLAAFIRPQPSAIAVELGGGTGIISLLLAAKEKLGNVTAVEVQPAFAELIDRNAALNRLSHKVKALCADLRDLRALDFGKEVDLVFSNPPYMKCDTGKRNASDEKYIVRHEVCGGIADFCAASSRLLKHGGRFVCVWRPDRLTELFNALRNAKLEPKRMTLVHADAYAEPSMVLVESVKGGAPSLYISPPLLLYAPLEKGEASRKLTPAAEGIYQTCNFSGLFPR